MKRAAPDPPDQTGGGLFRFDLTPTDLPQCWRNVVERNRFQSRLHQERPPTDRDDLGGELMAALREAIARQMRATPNLQPHHMMHFNMQSDHCAHAFQSTTFTVREFEEDSERLRTYLQSLADKLNSNEEF